MHRFLRPMLAALFALALSPAAADQGSFCLPTTGTVSGLQFAQAANDALKALATSHSGPTAPANDCSEEPVTGQLWLDSSTTPNVWKLFDGEAWLPVGTVDASGHIWVPPVGGGANAIASATTTSLWSVPESYVTVSGTATITGFGTGAVTGTVKFVGFSGAATLTHHATSLILPGAANIVTAAGDRAVVVALGGGNAAVIAYSRANGQPLVANSTFTSAVLHTGIITPPGLAGATNDWAPSGLAGANTIRMSAASAQALTGIASQPNGTSLTLLNTGAGTITLVNQSSGSSAANRFSFGADLPVGGGAAVALRYDGTTSRWVLAATAHNIATQAQAAAGTDNTALVTPLRAAQAAQTVVDTAYRFMGRQVWTSSGSYTPTSGARMIHVVMCGAGGGGGGTDLGNNDAGAASGGGGGGATVDFWMPVADLSPPVAISIGSGGSGGSSGGSNGGSGGSTSFGSHASANGGSGGAGLDTGQYRASNGGAGGTGGSGPAGRIIMGGQDGAAGAMGDGGAGAALVNGTGGTGGSSTMGGGGRGRTTNEDNNITGVNASNYCAGGGGAVSFTTAGAGGGDGSGGFLKLEEYR